jgi:hypothetical protein
MDTNTVFALCYAEGDGTGTDATWADSGIRLTVTKVYNARYQKLTGHQGPPSSGTCRPTKPGCTDKPDTKPREQTSNTLATNRLPRSAGVSLLIQGDLTALPGSKWVSIVALQTGYGFSAAMGLNPCVLPFYAGRSPSGSGDAQTVTGPMQLSSHAKCNPAAQNPAACLATVAQSSGNLLDASKTYAVCYAEERGTITDHTWRDSYIRLKISEITSFKVKIPLMHQTAKALTDQSTTVIPHYVVGQIPSQKPNEQVTYEVDGLIGGATTKIHLIDSATGADEDTYSGISNKDPCKGLANPGFSNPGGSVNVPGNKIVTDLHTTAGVLGPRAAGDALDASKVYSLCYTKNNGVAWYDSGIRLTIPKLTSLKYSDSKNAAQIDDRTREMDSTYRATNRFPRIAGTLGGFDYLGTLLANKYVSMVDMTLNSDNPCVWGDHAAAGASTQHSGKTTATGTAFTFPQTVLLDEGKTYAVCYAENTGNTDDTSWRDSYIRLGASRVSQINSFGVTHKTTGQIANHPSLQITYSGSLADGKYLMLMDYVQHSATLGSKTYPFPCANGADAFASLAETHTVSNSSSGKTVTISTTGLSTRPLISKPQSGLLTPAAGAPKYYAVCYSETTNNAAAVWVDSGIRVTLPDIIGVQMSSGFGTNRLHKQGVAGPGAPDGTLWRDMTSEPLAINRIPKMASQKLQYYFSRYSSGCHNAAGNYEATCASGNGKYISLVDASENGNDPCVLSTKSGTGSAPSTTASGVYTASAGTKEFTINAQNLDATKTYAVCYSKGVKLWSGTTGDWNDADPNTNAAKDGTTARPQWQDTYIRVKLSLLETLTTVGVAHRTYGQVPDVVATDKLNFVLSDAIAMPAVPSISLVDASLNNDNPCVPIHAAHSTFDLHHSTPVAAEPDKQCVKIGGTPTSTCGAALNELCTLGAKCNPATASGAANGGCGPQGQCRRVVSAMKTHGLSTAPGESTQYRGVPLDNALTGKQTHVVNGITTVKGRWFAVCYSASSGSWSDSGIRVTVPKVYNVRMSSQHTGVPDRDHTSLQLATNRIPRQGSTGTVGPTAVDQQLTYYGDLPNNKWLSVVNAQLYRCKNYDTTGNSGTRTKCDFNRNGAYDQLCAEHALCLPSNTGACGGGTCEIDNNPCVNGVAATAVGTGSPGLWGRNTGPKQATNKVVTFDFDKLYMQPSGSDESVYAVCYNEMSGAASSVSWYDSYIRLQPTEIGTFGTKLVMHKTTGQLPHHTAGLVYSYIGRLAASKHIALVDASENEVAVAGFSGTIARPCASSEAGKNTDSKHSGKHATRTMNNNDEVHQLDTTGLLTSSTFALCFAIGDGTTGASGGWQDSGIRLTISQLDSVTFSGYLASEAAQRNKKSRIITSTLPSLQTTPFVAPVLPKAASVPFRYGGDLGFSAYVSIVESTQNGKNPCANPAVAAGAASTTATGPIRSCISGDLFKNSKCTRIGAANVGNNCDANGDGVYDEPCAVGTWCLHSNAHNGGCGIRGGTCEGPYVTQGDCQHLNHGDGSSHTQNKEITFNTVSGLDTMNGNQARIFAVCYADTATVSTAKTAAQLQADPFDSSGRTVVGSSTWKDSFIRITFSEITSIIGTGVTHTDHGQVANHEVADKLVLTYGAVAATNYQFALVDETLGKDQIKKDRGGGTPLGTKYAANGAGQLKSEELNDVRSANEPCVWEAQAETTATDTATHPFQRTHTDDHTGVSTAIGAQKKFSVTTSGLDTSLQYAVCYSKDGSTWLDSGIRLKITTLHTLRDNLNQQPILKMGSGPFTDVSKFKRDLTSSRAKVGRAACLVLGTSPKRTCDTNDDGVFNEQCAFGALCDPDNGEVTGGCGSGKGVCNSGLISRAESRASGSVSAVWKTSIYPSTNTDYHKLRQVTTHTCSTFAASGSASVCDVNNDGIYAEQCVQNAKCNAGDTVNANGGCGTSGACSGNLELEYLGDLAHSQKVSLVDTRFNQNDPCVVTEIASKISHICSVKSENETAVCDVNKDGVFDEMCVKSAYCLPGPNNGGCGTTGQCTSALSTAVLLRQTGEISANNKKRFSIPSNVVTQMDTSKSYTLCYSAGSNVWVDSYIRLSVSKVEFIRSHQITHRTQGHLARADKLTVEYGGMLSNGKWLSLVSDHTASPCSNGGAAASVDSTGPQKAGNSDKRVQFKTTDLDPTNQKNFAVCYSEDGTTWRDSGIRVTISMVSALTYNLKTIAANQQGTVDYARLMTSTNVAPASDINPLATNRIPHAANIKLFSTDLKRASAAPLSFAIVETTLNKDFNPCATICNDDNTCAWNTFQGALGAASNKRTGVMLAAGHAPGGGVTNGNKAGESFTVPQAGGNELLPNKTYAVCYAMDWMDLPGGTDPAGTGTTWVEDKFTMRDSYIRLKPSKIYAVQSYAVKHYTFGDIPSKDKLYVSTDGTFSDSGKISLVDETANNYQPCIAAETEKLDSASAAQKNALKAQYSGQSQDVYKCQGIGGPPGNVCDVNKDGVYAETCIQNAYLKTNTGNPCGAGGAVSATGHYEVSTKSLSTDVTFAVCYKESGASWTDAGIRLQTPKVQSITYGYPTRVISADSCFSGNLQGETTSGLASCQVRSKTALAVLSDAHFQIAAILPRASDVQVQYGGPTFGSGLDAGKWLSLVEQSQSNFQQNPAVPAFQDHNPCRNAAQAANTPDSVNTPGTTGTLGQPTEGGMRLQSGPVQAATGSWSVNFPQTYDEGGSYNQAVRNFLDFTKTYAVCYSSGDGSTTDGHWRDSYIRVTLSKIKTLSMVHTGYSVSKLNVTTVGTYSSVPSLGLEWSGSLGYNRWLRIVSAGDNTFAPCDKSQADTPAGNTATAKVRSLSGSKRLTLDTAVLANTAQVNGLFVVCYATGDGSTSDNTWRDSGLRVRAIRWSNPQKHRVVSGAPVRLTFGISTSQFDTTHDKVAFLGGESTCLNAPAAPIVSDGNRVKRSIDYVCTAVDEATKNLTSCDANFDGVYNELCSVGALCNPTSQVGGGCGTANGTCAGAVQLPTGESYSGFQDVSMRTEIPLAENKYAICVCLGGSQPTQWAHGYGVHDGYGQSNGNGGCDHANEWTLIFSSISTSPETLKVISMPRLGRYSDVGGQLTLRQVAGMSQKYHIKASSTSAGFQVADNDKIYFVPKGLDCGQRTMYTGPGNWVYDANSNSYSGTNVDRRWRTQAYRMCTTVSGGNQGNNCDSNYDGVYNDACTVLALCNPTNPSNGGCGATGVCGSTVPGADSALFTSPISLTGFDVLNSVSTVTTPAGTPLSHAGELTACFATSESLNGAPTDNTDYVKLADGLTVIATPRLGPVSNPGHIFALENSSPSFVVNSMQAQDLVYFMPQTQSSVAPVATDCTPTVCTVVGGSNVGNTCDANSDGTYAETCVFMARCKLAANWNGGCGTAGKCEQIVPTVGTSVYTGLLSGANFQGATAELTLPSAPKLAVPFVELTGPVYNSANIPTTQKYYPTAWHLVACFIPAGSMKALPSNVKQLPDRLTVFKEPTDALVTSWFQFQVHELRFTQPQSGWWSPDKSLNFASGQSGDIVVLKKGDCLGVESITPESYNIHTDSPYNHIGQRYSARFVLEEAGNVTKGDENGGTATTLPLAVGKVNELDTGVYKICYATASSGGEAAGDFKMLDKEIEILPPPATKPSLSVPRSVILGQDIVVSWASNIGLQTIKSTANSWLGLYNRGECTSGTHDRHKCWKATQFIAANDMTGTVIFSQKDYKISGEYEIRYFDGNSRNGQGEECNGLLNVDHETYVTCQLNEAAISEPIQVLGGDIDETEDLSLRPGLEAVFGTGNRGRYHRSKLS